MSDNCATPCRETVNLCPVHHLQYGQCDLPAGHDGLPHAKHTLAVAWPTSRAAAQGDRVYFDTDGRLNRMTDCKHPFHTADEDDIHQYVGAPHDMGTYTATGLKCPQCGFQTFTAETYVPVVKPCAKCGTNFEGTPDNPSETCDACFAETLRDYFASGAPFADTP
jgi:DNA-directed RNA polymerase subunit RPC12/RpoP